MAERDRMSVEDQIRAAKTPGEALLVLAQAIDGILALLEVINARAGTDTGNPWAIPGGDAKLVLEHYDEWRPECAAAEVTAEWDPKAARAEYDRQLKALGDPPADPEDRQAWEKQRELLKDLLQPPTPNVGIVGETVIETVRVGEGFEVRVPSVSAEKHEARLDFATRVLKLQDGGWWSRIELAIDGNEAAAAYVKGGPLWLHAYDRAAVLQMPIDVRRAMVADIEEISPRDAQELSRDILKVTNDELGTHTAAIEAVLKGAR